MEGILKNSNCQLVLRAVRGTFTCEDALKVQHLEPVSSKPDLNAISQFLTKFSQSVHSQNDVEQFYTCTGKHRWIEN